MMSSFAGWKIGVAVQRNSTGQARGIFSGKSHTGHKPDTEKTKFRHTTYSISASDFLPRSFCFVTAEKNQETCPRKLAPIPLVAL